MERTKKLILRDSAVIAIIDIFGFSYFCLFVLHFLIFRFPSSTEAIIRALSVLAFSVGVIAWCLSSFIYRTIDALGEGKFANWQKLEFGGTLLLIYGTGIPASVIQFPNHPLVQLGYVCVLTLVGVGHLVDVFAESSTATVATLRFPNQCGSLGFLTLMPAIHAISQPMQSPSPLCLQLAWVAFFNTLAAVQFLAKPLERMGLVREWSPSLYFMHLVLMYSSVSYSRDILNAL